MCMCVYQQMIDRWMEGRKGGGKERWKEERIGEKRKNFECY